MSMGERAFCRAGRRDGDLDAADADRDQRAKLQKFEADGSGGGLRQFDSLQSHAAQGGHEHIGERRKP